MYFEGCPHWRLAVDLLANLQPELGFELSRRLVSTPDEAELLGFNGSPTIKVDGADPFARAGRQVGFACRIYDTPEGPSGSPTIEMLRKVIAR